MKFWTKDSSDNFVEIPSSEISCAEVAKKPFEELSSNERADKACDGSTDNKLLARFMDNGASNSKWTEVEFTLSSPKTVYKYAICTGNYGPERRPKEWSLTAKIDASSEQTQLGDWFLLDNQLDGALPTSFKTCKEFSATYEREVYRLHITGTRNAASDTAVQIGEIDWYANGVASQKLFPDWIFSGNDQQGLGSQNLEAAFQLKASASSQKWYSQRGSSDETIDLMFFFARNTVINKYRVFVANDVSDRDPTNWKVYHLKDDLAWYLIDTVTDMTDPGRFNSVDDLVVDREPMCACMKNYGFSLQQGGRLLFAPQLSAITRLFYRSQPIKSAYIPQSSLKLSENVSCEWTALEFGYVILSKTTPQPLGPRDRHTVCWTWTSLSRRDRPFWTLACERKVLRERPFCKICLFSCALC